MNLQEIFTNQIVIGAGITALLAVLSVVVTRKRLYGIGFKVSQFLNAKIGTKATQWLEDKLQELLNGMRADNEVKK